MQARPPQLLAPSPRFTGLTRSIPGRHWFAPDTFQKLIAASHTPVVGRLPAAMLPDRQKASPQEVLKSLDELANFLRPLRNLRTINLTAELSPGLPLATIKLLGEGEYGAVYSITIPAHQFNTELPHESTFAFKVYHDVNEFHESHGAFAETSAGLFLAKPGIYKDLSKFHCANPNSGWALYEYISPNSSSKKRNGPSFEPPKASGIRVNPSDDGHNRINGIRIDYGELKPILPGTQCPKFSTLDGFQKAASSPYPEIREQAIAKIIWLSMPEREEAFKWIMQLSPGKTHPEPNLKALMASQLQLVSLESRYRLYQLAMSTQDTAVQIAAARMIPHLPYPSTINKCYEEGLALARAQNSIELEAAVVSNLNSLSPDKIKTAYERAITSPHEPVQIAAVKTIACFPDKVSTEVKVAAYKQALKSPYPSVQQKAVIDFYRLPSDAKLDCFKTVLAHPNPSVQLSAARWFTNLGKTDLAEAYELLLRSDHPENQIDAASHLDALPEKKRFEAFKQALATGIPEVQAAAARHIKNLPEADRMPAFESVISTGVSKIIAQLPQCLDSLPPSSRTESFMRLINFPDEQTQTNTAYCISQLPQEDIPKAYKAAMASPYSQAKIQAAGNISNFSDSVAKFFSIEAFQLAMQSNDPNVQAVAARSINHLRPKAIIPRAYLAALATQNPDVQKAAIDWAPYFPWPYRNTAFRRAFQWVPDSLKNWVVARFVHNLKAKDAQPAVVRYLHHAKSQFTQLRDVQILTAER